MLEGSSMLRSFAVVLCSPRLAMWLAAVMTSAVPWLLLDPLLLPIKYSRLRWVQPLSAATLLPSNSLRWVAQRKGGAPGAVCPPPAVPPPIAGAVIDLCLPAACWRWPVCRCSLNVSQCAAACSQFREAGAVLGLLGRLVSPAAALLGGGAADCACPAIMAYLQMFFGVVVLLRIAKERERRARLQHALHMGCEALADQLQSMEKVGPGAASRAWQGVEFGAWAGGGRDWRVAGRCPPWLQPLAVEACELLFLGAVLWALAQQLPLLLP